MNPGRALEDQPVAAQSKQPASRRYLNGDIVACILAAGLGVLIVICRLGLWGDGIKVPITYAGDAIYEMVYVNGLKERIWNDFIPRLGAPFGMDTVDWPIGRTLDYAIIKALSFVTPDAFTLINLYWLTAIGLAAGFATLLLRYLSLDRVWAVSFGILFAIIPFTFFRNVAHLALVHFAVPGGVFLGLLLAQGKSLVPFRGAAATQPFGTSQLRIFAILAAVAAGLVFPYWAFFTCICIAIGCCIGFVRTKSVSVIITAALLLLIVAAAKLVDMTPTFVHWHRHGMSKALQYRNVADADIYGLTIRQMLRPVMANPVPVLRKIHDKISAAGFPNDQNESSAAALGTLAAAGFLLLVFVAICRPSGRMLGDDRIRILSAFVIAFVLIAEVGGFGSLFNIFVAREFRTYNRVSPFIALFCLAAVGVILDRALRRKGLVVRSLTAGAVVCFGVIDQIPVRLFDNPSRFQRYAEDRRFFSELEARLAPQAMIFQLPNTPLPPAEHLGTMDDYANVRPYLHTKALRWSWGTMVGRYNDWPTKVASLQPQELLRQLVLAGFEGILLNRYGYPDRMKEQKIAESLGAEAQFGASKEWAFFDLRRYRDELFRSLSPTELQKLQANAFTETSVPQHVPGTPISFGQHGESNRYKREGWSGTEPEFTWTEGNSATLEFPTFPGQATTLKVTLSALTSDPVLVYANDRQIAEWRPTTSPAEYTAAIPADIVDVAPRLRITFRITNPVSPKALGMSSDSRLLGICVYKLALAPSGPLQ